MNDLPHVKQLVVKYNGLTVGRLHEGPSRGEITFQYDASWLSTGFDLAPNSLAFTALPQTAAHPLFHGLHGAFAASLPDGWGLLLMDREFKRQHGWSPNEILPLDRLAYIGTRAMGALEYHPAIELAITNQVNLAAILKSVDEVVSGTQTDVLTQLRIQGGSPGGARPKVTVARSKNNTEILSGFNTIPEGYEHWMIKFRGADDPVDMGRIEMAYADMAVAAGIEMPETELIRVPKINVKPGIDADDYFFAVRRFDRIGNRKLHVIALDAILYADYRIPSLDYEIVLGVTQGFTQNAVEVERAFRLACFNTLAHNQDDHGKNFAMLHTDSGWRLAPGYDLTFSTGMGAEHTTAVSGSGKPDRKSLLRLAAAFAIKTKRANEIIEQVFEAVKRWHQYSAKYGVSLESAERIEEALAGVRKIFSS
ncbi:type II toxin-antitoxin system HipA family toxin [Solimicrobium silvestre]|uniref:HipA N-terminal domain n=1 Tax=Solimicrobium silvestre TaxID=2099400 RepID=A0A2S9H4C5_9BURK|nr:type II toxin-antitoxin system HipA family toxin [Solimicrobium silvestre]PRC94840.1 HipA N-terminal domain [Solimicrobium silvestre]